MTLRSMYALIAIGGGDVSGLAAAKAEVFKALGHPTRVAITEMLAAGERCVRDIVAEFDDSQATISRHLEVLLSARL